MHILEVLHDPARALVERCQEPGRARPLPLQCDTFIARSTLQKAVRRGHTKLALRAASTLVMTNSAIIWRRLLVTALEDLGIHQIGLLLRIAAAFERRKLGHKHADEWTLLALLIEECCAATRCQAANDLHNLSVHDPAYDREKQVFADLNWQDLAAIARNPAQDLVLRNIAVLTALGADHAPWVLHRPLAEVETLLTSIAPDAPSDIRLIYAWAFRKSRLSLATASLLLMAANGGLSVSPGAVDDAIPTFSWIQGVPSFALDQYTRSGRLAIKDFTLQSSRWLRFARGLGLSPSQQQAAAGELVFRCEGAVVTQRCAWDISRVLFQQSKVIGCHVPSSAVAEGLSIIRSELPLLDQTRGSRMPFSDPQVGAA